MIRLLGAGAAPAPRGSAFPIADVVQGWWEDPDLVHLAMKNGEVLVVKVESAAEGTRLLQAAGVTAAERVLRVPLASAASQVPGGSSFGGALLALFGSVLLFAFAGLAQSVREMMRYVDTDQISAFTVLVTAVSLLAFAVYAIAAALRRREVVVGTDGIAYKKTLTTEFIPYSNLARVLRDTRGVRLQRKDGRRLLLPTRGAGERPLPLAPRTAPARTPAEAQRRVLIERIDAAMAPGGATELAQVALSTGSTATAAPGATPGTSTSASCSPPRATTATPSSPPTTSAASSKTPPPPPSAAWPPPWPSRRASEATRAAGCASPCKPAPTRTCSGAPRGRGRGEIEEALLARALARRA